MSSSYVGRMEGLEYVPKNSSALHRVDASSRSEVAVNHASAYNMPHILFIVKNTKVKHGHLFLHTLTYSFGGQLGA